MKSIAEPLTYSTPEPDRRASRRARLRLWDRVMTWTLWGVATVIVALLAYMIVYLIAKGFGVVIQGFPRFLVSSADGFDGPELYNTFYIIAFALLISVPIGVAGAIYLVEYARQGIFVTVLRFATETLAGVPSIILGLFGFLVFVTVNGSGARFGFSRIAGALTLVILNLPLLLRVSEDALRNVANELREASAAVGASKVQTVTRVIVPAALPPLTTGVILTAGKMIGETAAIVFTAGSSSPYNGWFSLNPLFPGDTLTVHLFLLRSEGIQRNALQIENGTAALLIVFLLIFNLGFRGLAALLNRRFAGRTS
jgi:phosphate transport system permease protein